MGKKGYCVLDKSALKLLKVIHDVLSERNAETIRSSDLFSDEQIDWLGLRNYRYKLTYLEQRGSIYRVRFNGREFNIGITEPGRQCLSCRRLIERDTPQMELVTLTFCSNSVTD